MSCGYFESCITHSFSTTAVLTHIAQPLEHLELAKATRKAKSKAAEPLPATWLPEHDFLTLEHNSHFPTSN